MLARNARQRRYKARTDKALTRQAVRALRFDERRPTSSQQILWCGELVGFGVRVHSSGRKSWVCRYARIRGRGGRQRIFTLGRVSLYTLEEAREMAREMLRAADRGEDPVAAIQADRHVQREARSLRELVEEWLPHASAKSRTAYRQRLSKHVLPLLGNLPARDLTRADVYRARDAMQAGGLKGKSVNVVIGSLSAALSWGADRELVPENICRQVKPLEEATVRTRPLTEEEVRRLWTAASKLEDVCFGAYIRLAMILGTRRKELCCARWEDFDAQARLLILRETKNSKPTIKPLPELAVDLIQSLPRLADNPHLFPSPLKRGGHIHHDTVSGRWREICEVEGLPSDAKLHGVRSTLGDWTREAGLPIAHISSALAHSSVRITELAYARSTARQAALAIEHHAQAIARAAGVPQPPEA